MFPDPKKYQQIYVALLTALLALDISAMASKVEQLKQTMAQTSGAQRQVKWSIVMFTHGGRRIQIF